MRAWTQQPLKTGVAAALATVTFQLLHLPHGYWAVISAVIVMQSNLGRSISAGVNRLLGTAVGALVGTAVLWLAGTHVCGLFGCNAHHLDLQHESAAGRPAPSRGNG